MCPFVNKDKTCKKFRCSSCDILCPWCQGASDDQPEWCDFCWQRARPELDGVTPPDQKQYVGELREYLIETADQMVQGLGVPADLLSGGLGGLLSGHSTYFKGGGY
jgi:hypothetical protein